MQRVHAFLVMLPLFAGVAIANASARPQGHPHFNDGGTLQWSTSFEQAKAAAKKADKLIFLEYGRTA